MKSIYLHVFYLTIIAFLSYNYWSSVQAFKAFEHLDRQLRVDAEIMKNAEISITQFIEKNYKAYPSAINLAFQGKSEIALKKGNQAIEFIEKNRNSLNLDTITHSDFKIISPNNSFVSPNKIEEIKTELMKFHDGLIHLITDIKDKKIIEDNLFIIKTLKNEAYWNRLKYLPLNGISAQLSALNSQIQSDKIVMLNYFKNQIGGTEMICGPTFRTAIAPKKAALIEGETFEADIYLASYSSSPGSNVTFKVNGEPLEIHDGVAHFKSKNQTIGTKTIKAEAIIRNPLTGQTKTTEGSFEYQVLPKCSRDCLEGTPQ